MTFIFARHTFARAKCNRICNRGNRCNAYHSVVSYSSLHSGFCINGRGKTSCNRDFCSFSPNYWSLSIIRTLLTSAAHFISAKIRKTSWHIRSQGFATAQSCSSARVPYQFPYLKTWRHPLDLFGDAESSQFYYAFMRQVVSSFRGPIIFLHLSIVAS